MSTYQSSPCKLHICRCTVGIHSTTHTSGQKRRIISWSRKPRLLEVLSSALQGTMRATRKTHDRMEGTERNNNQLVRDYTQITQQRTIHAEGKRVVGEGGRRGSCRYGKMRIARRKTMRRSKALLNTPSHFLFLGKGGTGADVSPLSWLLGLTRPDRCSCRQNEVSKHVNENTLRLFVT